jgi:hypothetical protein
LNLAPAPWVLLENLRINLVSQDGTAILAGLLAEECRHPELLERFGQRIGEPVRDRLLHPLAQGVRDGQLWPHLDLEAAVSLLIGSLARRLPALPAGPYD